MDDFDLFISYSVKNSDVAEQLIECLENRGLRCWIAPRNISHGGMWAEEIVDAIKNVKDFVLIYSKDSYESSQIPKEIGLATSNKKHIYPFCIDDTPLDGAFLYHLSDCQMIQAQVDRKQKMEELADVLGQHLPKENIADKQVTQNVISQPEDGQSHGVQPKKISIPAVRQPRKEKKTKISQAILDNKSVPKKRLGIVIAIILIVLIIGAEMLYLSSQKVKIKTGAGKENGTAEVNINEIVISKEDTSVSISSEKVDEEALLALAQLTELKTLKLENVDLDDKGIEIIASMPRLQILSISGNEKVTDLSPLYKLENLTSLDVSGTGISDGSCFQKFGKVISLKCNEMDKLDENSFILPPKVQELECKSCGFEGLSFLRTADPLELKKVNVSGNQIKDISMLQECYKITELDVSDNQIYDISPLGDDFAVTYLNISGNQIEDISVVAGMEKLTRLDVSNNQIKDISPLVQNETFVQYTKQLDLSRNQISDISMFPQFPNLQRLDMSSNQLVEVNRLAVCCEKLEQVDISDNQITDISELAKSGTLIHLYALHNPLVHGDGNAVSNMVALDGWRYLHISFNEEMDWEGLKGDHGLAIKVYDVPEKEQYRIKEQGIINSIYDSGNGPLISFESYQEYADKKGNL